MTISACKIKLINVFSAVLLSLAMPCLLLASTVPEYSGAYAEDLVWAGTVTMAGDVLILRNASLTIRAGTQVNVVPAEGTKIDPEYLSAQTELLIRGRLNIEGTPERPVRFVILSAGEREEIAWSGITLDSAADSSIHHAELRDADIAIRCVSSSPEIMGNRIVNCRYGIVAQQQSHPKILNNQLVDGEGGIFCWNGSNPLILDNQLTGHDEEALFVDAGSRPSLGKNIVSGNAIGLAFYPRNLPYAAVTALDNQENVRWLGHQGQSVAK